MEIKSIADQSSPTLSLRLLMVLEATTVNAVAKNVLDFCESVAAHNHRHPELPSIEVSVATFDRTIGTGANAATPNVFVKAVRERGVAIDIVRERFRFDTRVIPGLKAVVARRRPDIIVTHNSKSHFLIRFCGLRRGRPWVAFHHGYTSIDWKNRLYNQLDRWSLPVADRVVAVCGPFARQLQDRGVLPERIIVRHNSIGPESPARASEVCEVRDRLGVGNGDPLILTVGRLSSEKGHVDLISAFAWLRQLFPNIHAKLAIAGEGPERSAMESAAKICGLEKDVHLVGHKLDVRPYYAAADVFVLPSRSEGSPYVLLEAMRAGVPIAASAVGGVPEILKHEETALLVKPQDSKSLAVAIGRILNDGELAKRIAENAFKRVSINYSLEAYVRSRSEVYRSLAPLGEGRHRQFV